MKALLLAVAAIFLASAAPSVFPNAALDRVIDGVPGFSGVVLAGDATGTRYRRAIGFADAATRRAHRAGDVWRWASVTKQITAILVMQEVERGRLALDRPISGYLPAFSGANRDRITIRQLLQHSSGLPNPNETPATGDEWPAFYRETGNAVGNRPAAFGYCAGASASAPGQGFSYNNCDYLVLGAILEAVTGKLYAALVAERIARPLRLRSLTVATTGRARTTVTSTIAGKPEPSVNLATFGAGGALVGTPDDLIALDRALLAGRLLSKASRDILWAGDPKLGYEALGVWSFPAPLKGCAGQVALIERRGEIGGVEVRNIIAPALGRMLVVFVNAAPIEFGEVWQGRGLSHDLLRAAFCGSNG